MDDFCDVGFGSFEYSRTWPEIPRGVWSILSAARSFNLGNYSCDALRFKMRDLEVYLKVYACVKQTLSVGVVNSTRG
jgi:hypothetical protein